MFQRGEPGVSPFLSPSSNIGTARTEWIHPATTLSHLPSEPANVAPCQPSRSFALPSALAGRPLRKCDHLDVRTVQPAGTLIFAAFARSIRRRPQSQPNCCKPWLARETVAFDSYVWR